MVNNKYNYSGPNKEGRPGKGFDRRHKGSRGFRKYKHPRARLEHRREEKPMPIAGKCSPLCSLFYCTQRALVVMNKQVRGHVQKVAFCRLTGSECIGAECQYAACRINSLLPDGRCAKAIEAKRRPATDEELFKEMESIEDYEVDEFIRG